MDLYILNFNDGTVRIQTLPVGIIDADDVEQYIEEKLHINTSNIQYMYGEDIELIDNRRSR